MMGLISTELRLPLAPVSAATEDRLRTVLANYGLLSGVRA